MTLMRELRKRTIVRLIIATMALSVVAAACSGGDSSDVAPVSGGDSEEMNIESGAMMDGDETEAPKAFRAVADDGSIRFEATSQQVFDAKIIRDGRLDIRIDPGTFGTNAEEIRVIAADLGGYVASGETHIEEFDEDRYAVGWYTMRIPSDRFDDAVGRIERLGERVSASVSSQDVTEEYVDLEGRLSYWREQEQFYTRLMDEAVSIDDMISIQTRMQEVLLTIEQIEGRLRYLDSRTDFATLTVGLTEVPDGPIVPVEPIEPSTIEAAFDQAGEVLLATVAFIIVAMAVAIPIGILVLFAYLAARLFLSLRRRDEAPSES
ncbi:MAG: DUF4349 domain-containing protein [Actinomycetota bacterium]